MRRCLRQETEDCVDPGRGEARCNHCGRKRAGCLHSPLCDNETSSACVLLMNRSSRRLAGALFGVLCAVSALGGAARAEDGSQGWLRYARPFLSQPDAAYAQMPAAVVNLDSSPTAASAQEELLRGVRSMLQRTVRIEGKVPAYSAWVLGTTAEVRSAFPQYQPPPIGPQGFSVTTLTNHGHKEWIIAGADAPGILYGTFHVLSGIARGQSFSAIEGSESPAAPIRWVNQWDNLNGTIERGYAGRSIFFDDGHVRADLTRAGEYARLLASIGINGCTINNVNADARLLTMIPDVARIADVLRPWGVRLSMSVDIASPQKIGGLSTYDPGNPEVAAWWRARVDRIYAAIPDFA